MPSTVLITEKIYQVSEELKQTGLWKKHAPVWVSQYTETKNCTENDFSDWLQFVFLPNLLQQAQLEPAVIQKMSIVPQAMIFLGEDVQKGKLLQLLIELDAFF